MPDNPSAESPRVTVSPSPTLLEAAGDHRLPISSVRAAVPQEVDVWWGAYATRTMWPSFVVASVLIAVICGAALLMWAKFDVEELTSRYSAYALVGLVLVVQVARWWYAILTFTYRLTTRRLLIERSFFQSGRQQINLIEIAEVAIEQQPAERWARVGRISVRCEHESSPTMILEGIVDPEKVAAIIRNAAKKAREIGMASPLEEPTQPDHPVAGHQEGES